jgi:ATP-dependent helicase/nuclease subunit B
MVEGGASDAAQRARRDSGGVGEAAPPLVVVDHGPAALAALDRTLVAAKAGDPLAPVTVAMPSTHAAVTVRRRLAAAPATGVERPPGLVHVQFTSLPQVVDLLAARVLAADGRPPLGRIERAALIRSVLADDAGPLGGLAGSAAVERSYEQTFAELADLDDAALDRLAGVGERAAAVVAHLRAYRRRAAGVADDRVVRRAAIDALSTGTDPLVGLGHVVVHLPRRLTDGEVELVLALHRHRAVTVVLGRTGDPLADEVLDDLQARLRPLGPVVEAPPAPAEPARLFVRAPDAEEEVRHVVRLVIEHLERVPAERVAIVSRVGPPYHLLLHEQLTAAGIPHHAPAATTLAQSVPGRALVGLLAAADGGFRRADVMGWLRAAPIRGPRGEPLPVSRLDRRARACGVSQGVEQWHERVGRRRADVVASHGDHDDRPAWVDRELADLDLLDELIDHVAALARPADAATWAGLAGWAQHVLVTLLGPRHTRLGWADDELDAYQRIWTLLDELASLDPLDGNVDLERFRRVLGDELGRAGRSAGRFGRGVFVGALADAVGADHDLLVVVGMAEGLLPPRGSDDPLLPDRTRLAAGVGLPRRRPPRSVERTDLLAATATAPTVIQTFAAADRRAGRVAWPSRWWLEGLRELLGRPVLAEHLDGARHPGFVDLPSFAAAPARATAAVDGRDHRVAVLQARIDAGGPAAASAALATDPSLARGAEAVVARAEGRFGEWTGAVGALPEAMAERATTGSATRFETWATCPFRSFLRSILDVRPLDDRGEVDEIGSLDRGSLVHEVLERFVGHDLGRAPEDDLDDADWTRLRAVVEEVFARYRAEGLTGRPLLWRLEADRLVRRIGLVIEADAAERRERGLSPLAVELRFGRDGEACPVEVALPSGRRVAFHGSIDRVDRGVHDGGLVVTDYKTGGDGGYQDLDADVTARGRHLQLPLYAEAARVAYERDDDVDTDADVRARFWFVERGKPAEVTIDAAARARLVEVVGTVVDGVAEGRFPANPGEEGHFGHDHCGFCEYDRVCPSSRGELWQAVRDDPSLVEYVALAEGPLPERAPPEPSS